MTAEIAIVVSPRDWAEDLHRFVADHGGARVRARVLDGREALAERYHVLVAEDLTSFLTPRLVGELHRAGRRLLGVYDPVEPWGRERLDELGADQTVPSNAGPEAMLEAIDLLAAGAVLGLDATAPPVVGDAAALPRRRGRITAVGGPAGGPGATEVALALAGAAARRRQRAVLVDLDDAAPSVAQRVGLPLHPNIRTAIDVVQHWRGQLTDTVMPVDGAGFGALVGLPSPRDWSDVRPGEAVDVLHELGAVNDHVIVNVGHRIEELGGSQTGSGRYALSRAALAAADAILAVATAAPVGVVRLLDWIAEVRAIAVAPLHVAFNRAPTARFKRAEIEDELRRSYSPPSITFLPADRRVEAAAWAGRVVAGGPFVRAIEPLAATLLVDAEVAVP